MKLKIIDRFRKYWFDEVPATDLAVCRILFYAGIFIVTWNRDFHYFTFWATVPETLRIPYKILGMIEIPPPAPVLLGITVVLWRISLAAACVGLWTRLSTGVAFLAGSYLLALPNYYGWFYHNDAFALFVLAILAISRPGDALSMDRILRRRYGPPPRSYEYRWPVALVCTLLALVYFGAGVTKLRNSGIEWIVSENMAVILMRHHITHLPPTQWGIWIAQVPVLPQLLAFITVLLEIGAPLALFGRKLRIFFAGGLFLLQIGVYLLLGLRFFTLLIAFCFWVPWGNLLNRLKRRKMKRNVLHVVCMILPHRFRIYFENTFAGDGPDGPRREADCGLPAGGSELPCGDNRQGWHRNEEL